MLDLKQSLILIIINIQLSPEGEVNSGGYIPRRKASRYISRYILIIDIYPGRSNHPKVVFREFLHPIELKFRNVDF